MTGLKQRIEHGLLITGYANKEEINVIAPPNRQHLQWTEGSILSTLTVLDELFVSKYEYDESGTGIVHQKCL